MPHENRLSQEPNPYLQQHKHNPVDWYPWGDEAFQKARAEDKPIFLSIGYSTCHWCHVMEHESFEDEEVAALLNGGFVSIKVDREERPDIDGIYMSVCQLMTGQGGWPLTIVMTPDLQPFYAATYIPKHGRHGRPGMMELVPRIQQVWQENRKDVLDSAEEITSALKQGAETQGGGTALDAGTLKQGFSQFDQRFDVYHGGFGTSPKFPTPHNLLFLLRYWKRTGEDKALRIVETTLRQMRLGGIFDQVGFGFHRYSTDTHWLVPHFEKMLYDQALLTMAYVEAYQVTKNPFYEQAAREILIYVLRDMTAPEGGFYSAEDADSEGQEGKFYVWTHEELHRVLGDEDAGFIAQVYNVRPGGNFEEEATRQKTGENIFHSSAPLPEVAEALEMEVPKFLARVEHIRQKLFEHREQRIHPGKDDKILTDWNGLMIVALAKAARVFREPDYAAAANRAADFALGTLRKEDGRLQHRYRNGQAGIQANLDDYAFLVWGLVELYETTFQLNRLQSALELNEAMLTHFWDEAQGAFFFTPSDGERLIIRQKEFYDGAVPSGNSVAFLNLLRLGRMTGNVRLEEKAGQLAQAASAQVGRMASGFAAFLMGVDFAVGPSQEIVVVGEPGAGDTQAMLDAVHSVYAPGKVVLFRPMDEQAAELVWIAPFVEHQVAMDGKATAYVCRNFQCNRPTTDVNEVTAQL